MRIALFGGTFDPPHRGHLAMIRAVVDGWSPDRIIVAPTGRQPLKPGGSEASFQDRWNMVSLMCAAENTLTRTSRLQPSMLDGPRSDGRPNYTIEALRQLRSDCHGVGDEIFVMVGVDAFLTLRTWRESKALLKEANWIVVSRPGFSLLGLQSLALTPEEAAHVHLITTVHEDVSATEVRRRLADGVDSSELLTPEVLEFIQEHGLYASR